MGSEAGFFASFFSLPFDFVKTQMQKQKKLVGKAFSCMTSAPKETVASNFELHRPQEGSDDWRTPL